MLVEQWESEAALDAHLERLQARMGPPPEGSRLPERLLDYFNETSFAVYEAVE